MLLSIFVLLKKIGQIEFGWVDICVVAQSVGIFLMEYFLLIILYSIIFQGLVSIVGVSILTFLKTITQALHHKQDFYRILFF